VLKGTYSVLLYMRVISGERWDKKFGKSNAVMFREAPGQSGEEDLKGQ
jgi:hypothetical protein